MPLEIETVETLGAAALHLTPADRAKLIERHKKMHQIRSVRIDRNALTS